MQTEAIPGKNVRITIDTIVRNHSGSDPVTVPNDRCGYKGLDHTALFAHGFITCPYADSVKAEKVIESVRELPADSIATITAEKLKVSFYHPDTSPVLVKCHWNKPFGIDGLITASVAVPLMLEKELHWSKVGETWETMSYYFLGSPHGARSSLFVNQKTGQTMKKVWNTLIYTGMFGPLRVGE